VPAWKAAATIGRTLASLVRDNGDAVERVVVVVSEDDGAAEVARSSERVEVVVLEQRATAGRARNVGRARAGDAELLLFVDADCALAAGSVQILLERMRAGELSAAGASIAGQGGGAVGWLRHLLEFKEAEPGVPSRAPRFLPSAALLVRAHAFDRVGGFPDMWPGEDLVLCRRLARQGARMAKVDGALAVHLHPGSVTAFLRHQLALGSTAAAARTMEPMEGSFLVGRPWLGPALLLARFARAVCWLARHRPRALGRFVCLSPLYLAGLAAWTVGFAGAGARVRLADE
jgi:GT2 family glycosyltransferase